MPRQCTSFRQSWRPRFRRCFPGGNIGARVNVYHPGPASVHVITWVDRSSVQSPLKKVQHALSVADGDVSRQYNSENSGSVTHAECVTDDNRRRSTFSVCFECIDLYTCQSPVGGPDFFVSFCGQLVLN